MIRDIDISTFRTFLTIIETGGFTAASKRLFRSQSAVSMQIRKLEDVVGGKIFLRATNGVALTTQGEMLTGYARRIVDMHDLAISEVTGDMVTGTVRIGVMDDYATHILPEMFAEFNDRNPGINIEVTTGFTSEFVKQLGTEFDLVLATQKIGAGTGRVLRIERTCWAFSANKQWRDHKVIPLALLAPGNLFRNRAIEALDRANIPWRIVYSSSSISGVESAAAAGIAVTVVKAGTARSDLRIMGTEEGLPDMPSSEIALHRAPVGFSPAARKLSEFLEVKLLQP